MLLTFVIANNTKTTNHSYKLPVAIIYRKGTGVDDDVIIMGADSQTTIRGRKLNV